MLRSIRKYLGIFFHGKFTYLLVSLILLFAFRPTQQGVGYLAIWELLFGLVFFSAVFNSNHMSNTKIISIAIGAPALLFDWMSIFLNSDILIVVSIVLTVAFLLFNTIALLYHEVFNAPATLGSLRPIVCAYFMIGFAFGYIYLLAEYFNPGTLQLAVPEVAGAFFHLRYLSQVIYFSFGNLATVGAGIMAALGPIMQTIAVLESVLGQLYIAILVARVVSVYAYSSTNSGKKK